MKKEMLEVGTLGGLVKVSLPGSVLIQWESSRTERRNGAGSDRMPL